MRMWAKGILAFIVMGTPPALIGSSESFQHCIHEHKNYQPYHSLHEEGPLLIKTIARMELHAACARVTVSQNDGAIAAIATVIIAIFTVGLWRSTDKLWLASIEQTKDMKASLRIAERAADAAKGSADSSVLQAQASIASEIGEVILERIDMTAFPVSRPWRCIPPGGPLLPISQAVLTFSNPGRTRATITELCVEWQLVQRESEKDAPDLPRIPRYTSQNTIRYPHLVAADRNLEWIWQQDAISLKAPDRSAIERDQAWLWVYGYFVYETVMRSVKPREIGFAAHWEGDMNPNLLRIPIGFVMNGPRLTFIRESGRHNARVHAHRIPMAFTAGLHNALRRASL